MNTTSPPPPSYSSRQQKSILAAVAFAVFVAADDLTVVTTMLRPIINDLGVTLPDGLDDAAWVVNAYLIAFVAVMPLAGRLSDVYGRRRVLLGSYGVFLIGSMVIPLSGSLDMFLAGRVLTALGGGAMVPVALAVVGDVYPEQTRTRALGTLSAIETFGWVWGPLYGAILVRFFNWQTQFWLNVPLALGGMAWIHFSLRHLHPPEDKPKLDWLGAGLLTAALVTLDLALLGNAEVQSVNGLDELTGGSGFDYRLLYPVAALFVVTFIWQQRRTSDPLIHRDLLQSGMVRAALMINLVVGAALVIAMVDVPILINSLEPTITQAAVLSGWLLSSMTASMAVASYIGGRVGERWTYRLPVIIGLAVAAGSYTIMGTVWGPESSKGLLAGLLAGVGAGLGATFAPTTSAVVDRAPAEDRGSAASAVMVVRLIGLSVGLAALTAWALGRFNALRGDLKLPPITDPGFEDALFAAQRQLTSTAIKETFAATAVTVAVGVVMAVFLRSPKSDVPHSRSHSSPSHQEDATMTFSNNRALLVVLALMAATLLAMMVWVTRLSNRLDDTAAAASETEAELARVESAAAVYAAQVEIFESQLSELEPQLSAGLDSAIVGLDDFTESVITFDVSVDETVTIETEVDIVRTVSVPIKTDIPIDETLDTTIIIAGPFGADIPIDVSVPVEVVVPVDLTVDVPINESVPISTDVPIRMDVPIEIEVSETELADLSTSLAQGLRSLQAMLGGIEG